MKPYPTSPAALPLLLALLSLAMVFFTGCGSLTGIPSHGGGKRFAVEQELVAASTRATIKQLDLTPIRGKKVNLFVNTIGDTGAGNLIGGRFSAVAQLRGNYLQTPQEIVRYASPVQTTRQDGSGKVAEAGVEYEGMGSYTNSQEITSEDLRYLSGLLETYFFLRGVYVVPPSEAEVDVYITVDVFGTVRTRMDWILANNEILRSKTAIEIIAVDHGTGELIMPPDTASAEAEYNEQYVLWSGPVSVKKMLRDSDPLLCDFTDLKKTADHKDNENKEGSTLLNLQEASFDYPFRYEIEKQRAKIREDREETKEHIKDGRPHDE